VHQNERSDINLELLEVGQVIITYEHVTGKDESKETIRDNIVNQNYACGS